MALSYAHGEWLTADGNGLAPGDSQGWFWWGFGPRDVLTVTAVPYIVDLGPTDFAGRLLSVENLRVESNYTAAGTFEYRLYFDVVNTGDKTIYQYALNYTFINDD